jgi:hypothetical protein
MPSRTGSEVPESIQAAERWRVMGARLRDLAPHVYAQLVSDLTAQILVLADENAEIITESNSET